MQLVPVTQFTEQLHQLYKENGKLRKEEEKKAVMGCSKMETLLDQFCKKTHMQNTHLAIPLVD